MASLISPGVSVTVTDESFFIPATATTVPLLFVATAEHKTQPDGITAAAGTYESNVIRTVTSLQQSTQLYGIPSFLVDNAGLPLNGDARNEYGLFALNQFLGIGNLSYIIRANVNLNDNITDLQALWDSEMQAAAFVLENDTAAFIAQFNQANGYTPTSGTSGYDIVNATATATAGYDVVNVGGAHVNGDPTNLVSATTYTATITIDGIHVQPISVLGSNVPTFGGLMSAITTQLGGFGTAALVGGNIRVTSATTGPASTVLIVNSGANPLFALPLNGFVAILGGVPGTSTPTGLANTAQVYAATITVDGVPFPISAVGSANQTYSALVATINGFLLGAGTAALVSNALRVTSATTGWLSMVDIVDTGVSGYDIVDVGGAQTNASLTSLVGVTTYTATITIDGVHVQPISVLGSTVTTFGDLVAAITTQLGGFGTAAIVGGNIKVTSNLTGPTSTVLIVNSGVNFLFAAPLSGFVAINAGVPGTTANLFGNLTGFTGFTEVDGTVLYKYTVTEAEFLSLSATATEPVWALFSFSRGDLKGDFLNDQQAAPFDVFSDGFNLPAVPPPFIGLEGAADQWVAGMFGSTAHHTTEWTPTEASNTLLSGTPGFNSGANDFKWTVNFLNKTALGSNDAARRTAIVDALQASINSNTDIRGDTFEYNLILCPQYYETIDELLNLCVDIREEAMVIADTPMNMNPDDVVTWAETVARIHSPDIAYYYPSCLASNLDGKNCVVSASGTALRTITNSDNIANVWFAPAGTRRGQVSGVADVGYVSGQLGTATTFVSIALNQGQRDNLYKYFTNINPIVFFPGRGILVWGQKTSSSAASALDRINVVRLVMKIKRDLRKNIMPFVFEPNDQLTRNNLKAVVDSYLGDYIIKRGLFDFATVCDASNNTPDRIDRNEMWIDVALKPTKAAEFIFVPIRIVNTGTVI